MELMDDIICRHCIFAGLEGGGIDAALEYFNARRKSYKKGEFLHRSGEMLESFGIVLYGTVHVFSDDINGHQMMMASVTAGGSFGESLCYLRVEESPVYICAAEDCAVLWLSAERLYGISSNAFEHELKNRFICDLAQRALDMNRRIQIMSKHALRDKLITFFTDYVRKFGTRPFTVPFDRSGMATYLGVDRSALSRELSQMKKEGVIDYNKNTFCFLRVEKDMEY